MDCTYIRQVASRIESLARRVGEIEKEKPDYISWHSVERIQELEAWVRKAGETIDGLKHQSDLAADYVVGLEKRLEAVEKWGRAEMDLRFDNTRYFRLEDRVREIEGEHGCAVDSIAELRQSVQRLDDLDFERVSSAFKNHLERIEKLEKLHYKGVAPIDEKGYHNWPEPKPHTCGECAKAWRSDKFKTGVMCYDFPNAVRTDRNNECPACSKFEPREGLCTA